VQKPGRSFYSFLCYFYSNTVPLLLGEEAPKLSGAALLEAMKAKTAGQLVLVPKSKNYY